MAMTYPQQQDALNMTPASYYHVTGFVTEVIKVGPGHLCRVTVNHPSGNNGIVTLYDAITADPNRIIAVIDMGKAAPGSMEFSCDFLCGLTVTQTGDGGTGDITVVYA